MPDDTDRTTEPDRPADPDRLEPRRTRTGRTRRIECGPTDEDRSQRTTRSGRGQREKEGEPSGRNRRRES